MDGWVMRTSAQPRDVTTDDFDPHKGGPELSSRSAILKKASIYIFG